MHWRIEIKPKSGTYDALGEGIHRDILDLGFQKVASVSVTHVYEVEGDLSEKDIKTVCRKLLADPIAQQFSFTSHFTPDKSSTKNQRIVEIAYNPGVMDPVEASTIKGIRDLGILGIESVSTAKKYTLSGKITSKDLEVVVNRVLANKLIQHVVDHSATSKKVIRPQAHDISVAKVELTRAKDKELMRLSQQGQLFLNLDEMKAIAKYFRRLKREPTDCELETIAQTWSEHCNHKTFRGNIRYSEKIDGTIKTRMIRNLLKQTIVKATTEIDKPWCVSVFDDNAGVIRFDKEDNVCFKVETHNHPSALEPYGGANTGIGGVIRDILGTGLGAKPVCCTDVFCFAPPETPLKDLPAGTLHPKRIMKGVVRGVRDYGNKMGIPTVNGAILFDDKFVGNPLVYCGNVGIMPRDKVEKEACQGDLIVALGGRTGRDGIHGATFSSGELTDDSEVISSGAVQIGDPIQEKKVLDVLLQARDQNLYSSITDCGAGGFSSAVGEMGKDLGARVDLDKAPLKYEGLTYTEIWISESQERMVLSVPPRNRDKILKLFAAENCEAAVIGEFTGNGHLELFYREVKVCDLDMEFLHDGIPRITKEARWSPPKLTSKKVPEARSYNQSLLSALSHYNVCSKEWVIRQYDHEVQGGSIIKPLVGINTDGPSDASVVAPKLGSHRGLAISNGINFRYGMIDPYWMAANCIDEAIRQIIAVGGSLDSIAILDNFCWGNPDKPDRLGSLVRAAEGCYKTAVGYQVPFISGKDSLYNEYAEKGKSIAIPGTLLISALGIVDDVRKTVTMDFKSAGNLIYCIGETFDEMGGSIYYDTLGVLGKTVPRVHTKTGTQIFRALEKAVGKGCIQSMHDCSEGGLAVALAEMAFSGDLGITAFLEKVVCKGNNQRDDTILYSESATRFLVEVKPADKTKFEKSIQGLAGACIGKVESSPEFVIYGLNDQVKINLYLKDLKEAWQRPLRW